MKKAVYYMICAIVGCWLCACSCGGADDQSNGAVPPSGNTPSQNQPAGDEADSSPYSMPETVIAENSQCVFTVTSVDPDGLLGFTVKARCENRSDRTLMFSWDECSVNGWMVEPFWAQEVTAGKLSNTQIVFDRDELKRCGITTVDEIEFELHIYDSEDWEAEPVVSEDYAIYPTGQTPGSVKSPERAPKAGEQVIADRQQFSFIIESADPEGIMGYTLMCYLENKTDDELMFSWDDVAVNGVMIDPFWAAEVEPGKKAYARISFLEDDLSENAIEAVERIEFRLRVYDADDWDEPALVDEVFEYRP